MSQFTTRSITPDDLDSLVALARASISADENAAFYQWKYFDNPAGQALGQCAFDKDELLGLNVAIPVALQTSSDIYPAVQQVDAMVLPDMRQLGLFTVLLDETFRRMDDAQVAMAFGFPAAIALKTVTSKFDWTHLLDVPRYVRVLDIPEATSTVSSPAKRALYGLWLAAIQLYARSRMRKTNQPEVQIEQIMAYDARFDDLWSRVSGELRLAFARTTTYLQWRYGAHPVKSYRCLGASTSGDLAAYVIFGLNEAQGAQTWEIVEFVTDPAIQGAGSALLSHLCTIAKREKVAQLTTWILPHQTRYVDMLIAAGFVHSQSQLAPRRFRYTTPFVVRSHPQIILSVSPFEADNWYLSMGDSDLH